MSYKALVRDIFNDMHAFFNGTRAVGLSALQDVYQEDPLFLAMISNLDQAIQVSVNDVMGECYSFYKKYADRELSEKDWEQVVDEVKVFMDKWKNSWSRQIILALLELLELEEKERKQDDVSLNKAA